LTIPRVEINKILYATDLSENAHHALAYAVSLADRYRARLSLIHVIEEETGDILVERGNPVEQILAQAEATHADLIVMGTHGQGTFKDAMMGSTARRVLRRSRIPVLVIRLPEQG